MIIITVPNLAAHRHLIKQRQKNLFVVILWKQNYIKKIEYIDNGYDIVLLKEIDLESGIWYYDDECRLIRTQTIRKYRLKKFAQAEWDI